MPVGGNGWPKISAPFSGCALQLPFSLTIFYSLWTSQQTVSNTGTRISSQTRGISRMIPRNGEQFPGHFACKSLSFAVIRDFKGKLFNILFPSSSTTSYIIFYQLTKGEREERTARKIIQFHTYARLKLNSCNFNRLPPTRLLVLVVVAALCATFDLWSNELFE